MLRLVLCCYRPVDKDDKCVPCYYDNEDDIPPRRQPYHLKARGYTLMGQYLSKIKKREGDKIYNNVSCNPEYMDNVMVRVRITIRDAYQWAPLSIPIFLYLDNICSHGT